MKRLFACLLMGCLLVPAWGAEPAITLEEFLQKLEKAEPWTREKVEALLGVKLSEREGGEGGRGGHSARGQFVFAKGLIVEEIELEVEGGTGETNMLILSLDEKSDCFRGRAGKLYPGGYQEMVSSNGDDGYIKEMPWGEWVFTFGHRRQYCLEEISIMTNAFIKEYGD
ncbi:MAG: hypothetical protein FWD67_07385 [Betaproteobacteria bacterium]|nr:hypothetical protein [Betaproteobacteria bacterium]